MEAVAVERDLVELVARSLALTLKILEPENEAELQAELSEEEGLDVLDDVSIVIISL